MKLQVTVTKNQLDRIASRLPRDDPRKRWTVPERKRLARGWIERRLLEEVLEVEESAI